MSVQRSRGRPARAQLETYRVDVAKLKRGQRILGTRTETETIHKALDLVADEAALAMTLREFVLEGRGHF